MKEIPLTQGYTAIVDDEDFDRVSCFKWRASIDRRKDGTIRTVYARRDIVTATGKACTLYLHRIIAGATDSAVQVDHKNRNGLDCTRTNLRVCTCSQNQGNSVMQIDNTSGFKGVSWHKAAKGWVASIRISGRNTNLGIFHSKEAAAQAYNVAAVDTFGEFALLNDVQEA